MISSICLDGALVDALVNKLQGDADLAFSIIVSYTTNDQVLFIGFKGFFPFIVKVATQDELDKFFCLGRVEATSFNDNFVQLFPVEEKAESIY